MDTVTTATAPAFRDQIIRDAHDLPSLIEAAKDHDPAFAASLTEKSLVGSKSVWFPLVAWCVTAAASHWAIGWDEATCAEIASVLAYAVSIGVRYVTRSPIGSILPQ